MSDLEQNFQPVRSFHTLQYRQIKRLSTGLSGTLKDSASPSGCVSANVTLTRTRPCFGTCSGARWTAMDHATSALWQAAAQR